MFQSYFQLEKRPFSSVPAPDQYFAAASIENARTSLVRLIDRREGPGLVVANVGLGKSLLCQLLVESFRHRCRTLVLPSGRLCTRRALLQVVLYELGLPYRDLEEGELRLSLIDHVTNTDVCPHGVLLLVDEADQLSMALLDELRSMTNLTSDGEPCVRLVLFGTPRLEEKFAHPRLESFNQRIAGRFYLEAFTLDETGQYILQQIEECGGSPVDVFSHDALQAIHRATEGVPRLVNQLADHALILAVADGKVMIDADCVAEAWADLQQLPAPLQPELMAAGSDLPEDLIEFGQLQEGDETLDRAEFHLDEIAAQMQLVDQPTTTDDRDSTLKVTPEHDTFGMEPEISLHFHEAHDPFGDGFDEEEVVVDHFISPDALSQRHRRQVNDATSESLANHIESLMDQGKAPLTSPAATNDSNEKETEDEPLQLTLRIPEESDGTNDSLAEPHEPATDATLDTPAKQQDELPFDEAPAVTSDESLSFDDLMTSGVPDPTSTLPLESESPVPVINTKPAAGLDDGFSPIDTPVDGMDASVTTDYDVVSCNPPVPEAGGEVLADAAIPDTDDLEPTVGHDRCHERSPDAVTSGHEAGAAEASQENDTGKTKQAPQHPGNYRRLFSQLRARRA